MATFVIGDVHGNVDGLKQALHRSKFDRENDTLITLGDICDGYSYVYEVVEELLTIKNRIDIVGNHDEPFTEFLMTGLHPWSWAQGGDGTVKSYIRNYRGNDEPKIDIKFNGGQPIVLTSLNPEDVPIEHHNFFRHQIRYYIDDENRLFIHGGFNRHFPIKEQNPEFFTWDRALWMQALSFGTIAPINGKPYKFKIKDDFKEIFIGHTATVNWKSYEPMKAANIWNLDTGAGFHGKLTIMNVDTHQFWQSDLSEDLYPNEYGRRKRP